jgi:D-sedoheptulose 7-phosphate isomerase
MNLTESILRKSRESSDTQVEFFSDNAGLIERCAHAMVNAFSRGGKLFVMGNGGSSCDAQHLAVEFMHPVIEKRPALSAIVLGVDPAYVSAISNDQDFSTVYASQLRMLGGPGDMALGISTSGKSASVVRGIKQAREMNMLTVGLIGRDGGRLASICDYPFVVPSFSIHRIQETHEILFHILWDLIHLIRGEEDIL